LNKKNNVEKIIAWLLPYQRSGGEHKQFLVKSTYKMLFLQAALIIITIFSSLILTNLLGAEQFGIFTYIFTIINILGMAGMLGLKALGTREISRYNTLKKWQDIRGYYRFMHFSPLIMSGIIILVIIVIYQISPPFKLDITNQLFLIALITLPVISLLKTYAGWFTGFKKIITANLPLYLFKPVSLIILLGILYLIKNELSLPEAISINVLSYVITFILAFFFLQKSIKKVPKENGVHLRTKYWLNTGMTFMFIGIVNMLYANTSVLVLGSMDTFENLGIYKIAMKLAEQTGMFLLIVNMVIPAVYAELHAKNQIEKLQRLIYRSTKYIILATLPLSLFLILFGKWILHFFGSDFQAGYEVMIILIFGQLMNVLSGAVGGVLNMIGKEKVVFKVLFINTIFNLLLSIVLVHFFSIIGAAISTTISMGFWNITLMIYLFRKQKIKSTILLKPFVKNKT
jgi:O-antigen/teichoic acid export membrane protein